jgi:tRNA(Arg) A34 adenosine deaminase TadA
MAKLVGVFRPNWIDQLKKEVGNAEAMGEVPLAACCIQTSTDKAVYAINRVERDKNPLAHAECLVIQKISNDLQTRYLTDVLIISTLEPCTMCMGAIANARIPELIYVCADEKGGYFSRHGVMMSSGEPTEVRVGTHHLQVTYLSESGREFQKSLTSFFSKKRFN